MKRPRKILVYNDKGGVGKSTSVVNISAALSRLGYKVLLIDVDPQCSATIAAGFYLIERSDNPPASLCDLIRNIVDGVVEPPEELIKRAIIHSETGQFDIISNTPDMKVYQKDWNTYYGYQEFLKMALEPVKDYDYIILDSPAGLTNGVDMCFVYAEELYVPISADFYGIKAFKDLEAVVAYEQENFAPHIRINGVFNTMTSNKSLSNTIVKATAENFKDVYISQTIRVSEQLRKAPMYTRDIFSYDPKSIGAHDYMELAKIIANRDPDSLFDGGNITE